jgi:hypothetical protein
MSTLRLLVLCFGLVFVITFSIFAQEAQEPEPDYGWHNEIVGNLNLTQASFDNWTQGGENTLAWQISLKTEFKLKQEKYEWVNATKFSYGSAKVGNNEARKSADEIKFESVYTRKLNRLLNPFVAITAATQFTAGFKYDGDAKTQVSKFMDPGYFTQSVGLGYAPNEEIKTRLGVTVKETITSDFSVPYADEPDTPQIEKTKVEPGISSITEFKRNFDENILFNSRLDLFSDLEAFDRIDVLWENNLSFKISKFFNVNFNVDLFYDKDISKRRQLKQVLAVGLTYTFL